MAKRHKEPQTLENAYKLIKQLLDGSVAQNDRIGSIESRINKLEKKK